jgi:hypothetical protein
MTKGKKVIIDLVVDESIAKKVIEHLENEIQYLSSNHDNYIGWIIDYRPDEDVNLEEWLEEPGILYKKEGE